MSAIEIPGYKIIKTLGVGGQATVYLAIQDGFERKVALKIMSPALAADPTFGDRFLREAKIVSKLSHSKIVTVYDVGESGRFYYLAMEYMPGLDLKHRINKGIKNKEALLIVAKLAQALHFAHKKGYVHRDVKSENILFDEDDQPVLTDFGIAKASNSSTQMTQTGKLIGTPEYMSPEQCRGRKVDGRSDLYSLGIILYEMITRKVPFRGEDSVSVCIQHVTKPVPRLPARLSHLQWLIDGLLDKKADNRFQTGQELALSIKNYLTGGDENKPAINQQHKNQTRLNEPSLNEQNIENDFENIDDESLLLHDDYEVNQRINVLPENKSRVPVISFILILVILSAGGYVTREHWIDKAYNLIALVQEKILNQSSQSENKNEIEISSKNNDKVNQLIQQADTLAQYSPHELTDIQQALDHLVTAKSLQPNNKNINTIKSNLIFIAFGEVESSAKNNQFDHANEWLKLIEKTDHDNVKLDSEKKRIADYHSNYNSALLVQQRSQDLITNNIEKASRALSENRLTSPKNNNAVYYYRLILETDKVNAQAIEGLNLVADKYVTLIKKALPINQFNKIDRYYSTLKTLPKVSKDYSDLDRKILLAKKTFKKKQLKQKRKAEADRKKRLIAEKRQEKLSDPLIQMRLQGLLESAGILLEEGFLVEPIGNNALVKYKSVLEIDQQQEEAIKAIERIENTILSNLDVSISNSLKESALLWLGKLKVFNPKHQQLTQYETMISEMIFTETETETEIFPSEVPIEESQSTTDNQETSETLDTSSDSTNNESL